MKKVIVYTDGASRGNPGHAGIGVVLYDEEGNIIKEIFDYIGQTTNNIAEYKALIAGLNEALEMGYDEIEFYADSELMIKQINGLYKVKNEGIKPLYKQVCELLKEFQSYTATHIPREKNKRADELANEGIKQALDVNDEIEVDI